MSAIVPAVESGLAPYETARDVIGDIRDKALARVRAMWLPEDHPDYNPDGLIKRSACPMRTAAAVELTAALIRSEHTSHVNVTIKTISIPEKRDYVDVDVVQIIKEPGE